MTTVSSQRWLKLYGALPATTEPEHDSALRMFEATLARSPDSSLMHYFDTPISARDVDEASSALAAALRDRGVQPGNRVAMYLSTREVRRLPLRRWTTGSHGPALGSTRCTA
jgi:long-chain acyl-CoA synthetase